VPTKDYYQILNLQPGADAKAIKRAYRQLAMLHHPDKKPGDASAHLYFQEIQTAYTVLTDPIQKELYLQERWLEKSKGRDFEQVMDPYQVLSSFIELEKEIAHWEKQRNSSHIADAVISLLSTVRMTSIQSQNDHQLSLQILQCAKKIATSLNSSSGRRILEHLSPFAKEFPSHYSEWEIELKQIATREYWKSWRAVFIGLFTCLICLLFYYLTRR
jgi:curved DNA-binding protein CbpA